MGSKPLDPDEARGFASDNFAGVHPRVMERLADANRGHARAYGDDAATARMRAAFSRLFGQEVTAHLVWNGTAANNLALMAFARPYGAVICSDVAHLCNDESTAPERFLGMRLLPVLSEGGKVTPAALGRVLGRGHGVHNARPVALTLTQPTELGTVYSVEELRALVALAHDRGLGVHVDGATQSTRVMGRTPWARPSRQARGGRANVELPEGSSAGRTAPMKGWKNEKLLAVERA